MEKDIVWLMVALAAWVSLFWCVACVALMIFMHNRR